MPVNVPSGTTNNISFGPATIFLGASGTTPTVDVGYIDNDTGVEIVLMNKKRDITQGNPKVKLYTFSQEQGVTVKLTGIEWNNTNFAYALGAGTTAISGSEKSFTFGGDPIAKTCALQIQHYMPVTGHTMMYYCWKAVSDGDLTMALTHDEHKFPYSFALQRASTDWAGNTLTYDKQLLKVAEIL